MTEPRYTEVRTCMDRYEWPNEEGKDPVVMYRFVEAEKACADRGKRLCTEFEWELACEGPERLPWPYGWEVEKGKCHVDRPYRSYDPDKVNADHRAVWEKEVRRLWQGEPSGSFPECRSHYGVMDLVGSVEEWVATSRPEWPYRSSLKGGYWSKSWTGCRGTNESHSPQFRFYQIGFRCCRDPQTTSSGPGTSSPTGAASG
jgi:formylglycine-generating enzyme required for sulfatase activity